MRWLVKAASQKALSALPRSHELEYVLQRRVTRSLPASDAAMRHKLAFAHRHYDAFLRHGGGATSGVFYEFGSGWDLLVPLAYYALGIERQILVDIDPNVRFELVVDSAARLPRLAAGIDPELQRPLRPVPPPLSATTDGLAETYGIEYLAPRDARATGLPAESVEFVSSTNTLEHVPEPDIARILAECHRLLTPGGAMSCRIDLQDHYSYFDKTVSRYNFLRFSDRAWSVLNSSLHYQNRLRASDHLRLFREAGFDVVEERVAAPTEDGLRALAAMELAPRFRSRPLDDLGATSLFVVARKA